MNHLLLFEKFAVHYQDEKSATEKLKPLDQQEISFGIKMLQDWFYGGMMSKKGNMLKDVTMIFRKIAKTYHEKYTEPFLYRTAHLHLPKDNMSDEEIMKITKAQTGPKELQSWSMSQKGAEWFFKHFTKEQNHRDRQEKNMAWCIVKVSTKDVEEFLTFKECMDFFEDVVSAGKNDKENVDRTKFVKALIKALNSDEMTDLEELICYTPMEIPIEVVKVLVSTGNTSNDEQDEFLKLLKNKKHLGTDDRDNLIDMLDQILGHRQAA